MKPILDEFPIIKFLFNKVRNNLFKVAIIFLMLSGLFILEFWFEHQVDSSVSRWDTINNSLIIITGEYPDAMKSLGGRIIQLVLLIFGTLFLSAIIGSLSSFFVTEAAKVKPPSKKFKNHFIICNWNSKASKIIEQLEKGEADNKVKTLLNFTKKTTILIISSEMIKDQDDIIERYSKCELYFINDDPSHHEVLRKYGANEVKSIILLADEKFQDSDSKKSQDSDSKNALIALAVKQLEKEANYKAKNEEKDIKVIAELSDDSHRAYLENAGADEVIGKNYCAGIIAQTAIFPEMSIAFDNLLKYSDNTNEFYFISGQKEYTEKEIKKYKKSAYPTEWIGKSFDELVDIISEYYSTPSSQAAIRCRCTDVANKACCDAAAKRKTCSEMKPDCSMKKCPLSKKTKNPLLLVGIKRGTTDNKGKEIFLNPKPGEINCLMEGDSLIIMAYDVITEIK